MGVGDAVEVEVLVGFGVTVGEFVCNVSGEVVIVKVNLIVEAREAVVVGEIVTVDNFAVWLLQAIMGIITTRITIREASFFVFIIEYFRPPNQYVQRNFAVRVLDKNYMPKSPNLFNERKASRAALLPVSCRSAARHPRGEYREGFGEVTDIYGGLSSLRSFETTRKPQEGLDACCASLRETTRGRGAELEGACHPVAQKHHAIAEAALFQKLQFQADVRRQGWLSPANDDRGEQQLALVYQPRAKGVGGEIGAPDKDILPGSLFQQLDGCRVEGSLQARLARGDSLQGAGVHGFIGCLPDLGEVAQDGRLGGEAGVGFPNHHGLVHPAPIQKGAGGTHEIVDEAVDFFVGRGPIKTAVRILDIPVQRRDCQVDQVCHAEPPFINSGGGNLIQSPEFS